MTAAYTPGPWKVVDANGVRKFNKLSIRPVDSGIPGVFLPLASVCRFDYEEFGLGCGEANARLIAAALDLLAALQAALLALDADPDNAPIKPGVARAAQAWIKAKFSDAAGAAIAKATGEAA